VLFLGLPATRLKAKILAEERQHMILETIRYLAGVSTRIDFEGVRDSLVNVNSSRAERGSRHQRYH
jgi:hypothetical protein